jgi:GH24 family phage-related lysozyme (muramidase)
MYSHRVWGYGHSNQRIITPETLAFHERWELFVDHWYPDGIRADGSTIWSCMFGHAEGGDNPPFKMTEGERFTIEQGRDTLAKDIAVKERWVNARFPVDKVPLTTFMYGTLVSLAFQFGQGRLDWAQKGLHPPDKKNPEGRPLIIDGEPRSFPFIRQINEGKYVDGFCTILDLNFKKDGTVSKGHKLRRASEVGFAMVKKD